MRCWVMNIKRINVMCEAEGCLDSAASIIQDLAKPNSGLYRSAETYRIVAKHLREEIAKEEER